MFWAALGLLAWTWAGYPGVLMIVGKLVARRPAAPGRAGGPGEPEGAGPPGITMIIPVFNADRALTAKLRNCSRFAILAARSRSWCSQTDRRTGPRRSPCASPPSTRRSGSSSRAAGSARARRRTWPPRWPAGTSCCSPTWTRCWVRMPCRWSRGRSGTRTWGASQATWCGAPRRTSSGPGPTISTGGSSTQSGGMRPHWASWPARAVPAWRSAPGCSVTSTPGMGTTWYCPWTSSGRASGWPTNPRCWPWSAVRSGPGKHCGRGPG